MQYNPEQKLVGLSLSACVRDIADGKVYYDQVDKIIAGTAAQGWLEELQAEFRKNIQRGMDEMTEAKVEGGCAEAEVHIFNGNFSWEALFESYSKGPEWRDHNPEKCVEIATRLVREGKVDQPRLRDERPPVNVQHLWRNAATGEQVDFPRAQREAATIG